MMGSRSHRNGKGCILKAHGVAPVPGRPTSWETFLRAHWVAIAGADVLRPRSGHGGLLTDYSVFVIDRRRDASTSSARRRVSRAVHEQVCRTLTAADEGLVARPPRACSANRTGVDFV